MIVQSCFRTDPLKSSLICEVSKGAFPPIPRVCKLPQQCRTAEIFSLLHGKGTSQSISNLRTRSVCAYLHMWSQILSVVSDKVTSSTSEQVVSSSISQIVSEHTSVCHTCSRFRGRKMQGKINDRGEKPPIGENMWLNMSLTKGRCFCWS